MIERVSQSRIRYKNDELIIYYRRHIHIFGCEKNVKSIESNLRESSKIKETTLLFVRRRFRDLWLVHFINFFLKHGFRERIFNHVEFYAGWALTFTIALNQNVIP